MTSILQQFSDGHLTLTPTVINDRGNSNRTGNDRRRLRIEQGRAGARGS